MNGTVTLFTHKSKRALLTIHLLRTMFYHQQSTEGPNWSKVWRVSGDWCWPGRRAEVSGDSCWPGRRFTGSDLKRGVMSYGERDVQINQKQTACSLPVYEGFSFAKLSPGEVSFHVSGSHIRLPVRLSVCLKVTTEFDLTQSPVDITGHACMT